MNDSSITFSNLSPSDCVDLLCFRELLKQEYGDSDWAQENLYEALTSIFVGLENAWEVMEERHGFQRKDQIGNSLKDHVIYCVWKIVTSDSPELRQLIKRIIELEMTNQE